jgi:hypothetical protein
MNILNMVYTLRFSSSKCSSFHNSNVFGSSTIHILNTGVLKFKKKNSGTKRLNHLQLRHVSAPLIEPSLGWAIKSFTQN